MIILLALIPLAHIKTSEVETLEELMVTQTAKVEDKLVDLIENSILSLSIAIESIELPQAMNVLHGIAFPSGIAHRSGQGGRNDRDAARQMFCCAGEPLEPHPCLLDLTQQGRGQTTRAAYECRGVGAAGTAYTASSKSRRD